MAALSTCAKNEPVNRLAVLFLHLLKWRYQPRFRSTRWRLTIKEQRYQVKRHAGKNPSLKPFLEEAVADDFWPE
jgi:hypothetical protein